MARSSVAAASPAIQHIAEHFQQYFSILPANTTELKKKIFRLRYDVYCEEFHYEPRDAFPDAMEQDEYDTYATHVLVEHKATGLPAGCTRIVPAQIGNTDTPMPFEKYCQESLEPGYMGQPGLPRSTMCEASRLAVHTDFRRRHGESATPYGHIQSLGVSPEEQRTFPLIVVAISLATTALTELTGQTNMFAMMEPFLPRILGRIGYNFKKVGTTVEYHGKRAAYMVDTESVLRGLKPEYHEFYLTIRDMISSTAPGPGPRPSIPVGGTRTC